MPQTTEEKISAISRVTRRNYKGERLSKALAILRKKSHDLPPHPLARPKYAAGREESSRGRDPTNVAAGEKGGGKKEGSAAVSLSLSLLHQPIMRPHARGIDRRRRGRSGCFRASRALRGTQSRKSAGHVA